jgi:hypothetical protein
MRLTAIAIWAVLLAACQQRAENSSAPAPAAVSQSVPAPVTNAAAAGKPQPLAEPKGSIDLRSAEGARNVVERYCALLKTARYKQAHALWSGDSLTDAQFERGWIRYGKVEGCPIYEVGQLEGAAGSIYVEVSLQFFISRDDGGTTKLSGPLTLRRVNDVPGSTEEQRRWHIMKADLQPVD